MKKLILLTLMFSSSVFAYPVPKPLEDGKIQVKTKNGKTYKFDSNTHKVVKRGAKSAPVIKESVIVITQRVPELKNRVTLLGGVGPSRKLFQDYYSDRVKIYTKTAPIIGASYDRKFEDFSLRGTILSNRTYLLGLGWDF